MEKRRAILLDLEGERVHQICSFMWADNFWIMSHSKEYWSKCYGTLLTKQADGTWYPNMQVCGVQVCMIQKNRVI